MTLYFEAIQYPNAHGAYHLANEDGVVPAFGGAVIFRMSVDFQRKIRNFKNSSVDRINVPIWLTCLTPTAKPV